MEFNKMALNPLTLQINSINVMWFLSVELREGYLVRVFDSTAKTNNSINFERAIPEGVTSVTGYQEWNWHFPSDLEFMSHVYRDWNLRIIVRQ